MHRLLRMSLGVGDIWAEIKGCKSQLLNSQMKNIPGNCLNEGRFLFQSSSMWHLG